MESESEKHFKFFSQIGIGMGIIPENGWGTTWQLSKMAQQKYFFKASPIMVKDGTSGSNVSKKLTSIGKE